MSDDYIIPVYRDHTCTLGKCGHNCERIGTIEKTKININTYNDKSWHNERLLFADDKVIFDNQITLNITSHIALYRFNGILCYCVSNNGFTLKSVIEFITNMWKLTYNLDKRTYVIDSIMYNKITKVLHVVVNPLHINDRPLLFYSRL
jgi:hypothetical protein